MATYAGNTLVTPSGQIAGVVQSRVFEDVTYISELGSIVGTTKVQTAPATIVPVQAVVILVRDQDLVPVRRMLSDPTTGAYAFNDVPKEYTYTVLAQYIGSAYRSVLANGVSPT